jgi:integrase
MPNRPHPEISCQELERVALDLLEDSRRPIAHGDERAGIDRAANVRTSLILRLLVRIPLRQRQVRELQLERNLFQDFFGRWQLRFTGAELKVSHRGGRLNIFALPFPEDLVPDLEAYLERDRPCFPTAETSPYLFLTARGRPLNPTQLCRELQRVVLVRTGKPFSPHLIRVIWATEYLRQFPMDWEGAAYWLNNTIKSLFNRLREVSELERRRNWEAFNHHLTQGLAVGSPPSSSGAHPLQSP